MSKYSLQTKLEVIRYLRDTRIEDDTDTPVKWVGLGRMGSYRAPTPRELMAKFPDVTYCSMWNWWYTRDEILKEAADWGLHMGSEEAEVKEAEVGGPEVGDRATTSADAPEPTTSASSQSSLAEVPGAPASRADASEAANAASTLLSLARSSRADFPGPPIETPQTNVRRKNKRKRSTMSPLSASRSASAPPQLERPSPERRRQGTSATIPSPYALPPFTEPPLTYSLVPISYILVPVSIAPRPGSGSPGFPPDIVPPPLNFN